MRRSRRGAAAARRARLRAELRRAAAKKRRDSTRPAAAATPEATPVATPEAAEPGRSGLVSGQPAAEVVGDASSGGPNLAIPLLALLGLAALVFGYRFLRRPRRFYAVLAVGGVAVRRPEPSLRDAVAFADGLAAETGRRHAVYEVEPDADDPDAMIILQVRWRSWVEGGRPPREPAPAQPASVASTMA